MILQTSKGRLAIGIALLALTPVIAFDHGWFYWQLASDGVTAPAVVTKVERRRRPKAWFANYYVDYEFTDLGGRQRIGRQEIGSDLYEVLAASKPDRDIVIHYSRSKPWLSVISVRSLRNELLVRSAIAVVAWLLIVATLIAQRREKAGIIGTIRQRLLIDRGRRGPAVAGRADREGPSQR